MLSKALVVANYRSKLRELSRLGPEMIAVVPPAWKEAGHDIPFEPGNDAAYRVIQTPMAWNGHYHVHYYPALGRIIAATRPDIVHIDEEPYNLATYLAMHSARRYGSRSIFFTWQNIDRRYPPPFRQIERYVYSKAEYGLAGSPDALVVLRNKGYGGRAKVVPQFGVDIDGFVPAEREPRPFTVGFLGRLVPEKGIADLLAAFKTLDPPARLIIAGEGPMSRHLDVAGADLQRNDRLERLPRVPSSEMPRLLHRLDVLVLASRATPSWREQYGRILIEAMASGVVVVGSDSGEIPNVIGDAGMIVPEGNVHALGKALHRLAESTGLREELAHKGRGRAVSLFSQASIAAQTYEAYQEVLNGA